MESLPPDHRRTLELLARSPNGIPEGLIVHAHGVPLEVLVKLINAGLAKVRVGRIARPRVEVARSDARGCR
jgi:hypothetical protein